MQFDLMKIGKGREKVQLTFLTDILQFSSNVIPLTRRCQQAPNRNQEELRGQEDQQQPGENEIRRENSLRIFVQPPPTPTTNATSVLWEKNKQQFLGRALIGTTVVITYVLRNKIWKLNTWELILSIRQSYDIKTVPSSKVCFKE